MSWHTRAVESMPFLDKIGGWLDAPAARITDFLLRYQTGRNIIGDLLEIGVYEGKYFLVLCQAAQAGERVVAIDIFQSQQPVLDSAHGVREVFEANLKKYAPRNEVVIMESDSTILTPSMVTNRMMTSEYRPFRFISIDGGHDEATVFSDLLLSEMLLMPGGIVALDDWRPGGHPTWPEVISGEVRYQAEHGRLMHIGSIPNKLLLSNDPFWVEDYRRVLRDYTEDEE